MMDFLRHLKEEHKNDDKTLIALGEIEAELNAKKYGLVWEQHEEAVDVKMRTNIPVFTEVPEREIAAAPGESYNFLLEGDNLHSLRLLEKTHKGRIDVIYIDPPYNTGNKDFKYDDVYLEHLDGYLHSKWISFIEKRLRIASRLLKDTGCIMISINENEYAPLKLLCDDIFGPSNYMTTFVVKVRHEDRILKGDKDFHEVYEYLLFYRKSANFSTIKQIQDNTSNADYVWKLTEIEPPSEVLEMGGKKVECFLPHQYELKQTEPSIENLKRISIRGSIKEGNSSGRFFMKYLSGFLGDRLGCVYKVENMGDDGIGYRYFIIPDKAKRRNGDYLQGVPQCRSDIKEVPYSNFVDFQKEFNNVGYEGGVEFRNGKKPIKFLQHFMKLSGLFHGGMTVLDFFAGSGSTGHALLEYNLQEHVSNQFILCTNNEANICEEITYKRMYNVAMGFVDTNNRRHDPIPFNLKYYRTDFVPKDEEYLSDALIGHIAEMIQLEHGIKLDGKRYIMVLTDEEADALADHWSEHPDVQALYVSRNVLFTTEQNALFRDVEKHIIPDYYFNFELREEGETW